MTKQTRGVFAPRRLANTRERFSFHRSFRRALSPKPTPWIARPYFSVAVCYPLVHAPTHPHIQAHSRRECSRALCANQIWSDRTIVQQTLAHSPPTCWLLLPTKWTPAGALHDTRARLNFSRGSNLPDHKIRVTNRTRVLRGISDCRFFLEAPLGRVSSGRRFSGLSRNVNWII